MPSPDITWEPCEHDECTGICLPTGGRCWAHAAGPDLDAALKRLSDDGHLDARGVPISPELLGRLLAAAPRNGRRSSLASAQFERAIFQRGARFNEVVFQSACRFEGATFQGDAWFVHSTFQGPAQFDEATFQRVAMFFEATFRSTAWFEQVTFHDGANFQEVIFDSAMFDGATFRRGAWFRKATFHTAVFKGATFHQAREIGPMLGHALQLDQVVFHEHVQIDVAAATVSCRQARFLAGMHLRARWAEVVLDDADLAAPSILASAPPFPGLEEGNWAHEVDRRLVRSSGTSSNQPRLLSVRRANLAGLSVAGVDMRACRFTGAHHLDQLRIEGSANFAWAPQGWRWTTRQTIAEEHHWRAHTWRAGSGEVGAGNGTWYPSAVQPPASLEVEPLGPAQIAELYRALRKGREDAKDEPGAADFYYGEMEMRRHDPNTSYAERLVLLGYWLLSGYALRASRALAWLLGVLTLAAVLLAAVGLAQPAADWSFPARLGTAAMATLEGATFRTSEQLTYTGRLIQILLRFAAPVLFGLALLSIRGRVKR